MKLVTLKPEAVEKLPENMKHYDSKTSFEVERVKFQEGKISVIVDAPDNLKHLINTKYLLDENGFCLNDVISSMHRPVQINIAP